MVEFILFFPIYLFLMKSMLSKSIMITLIRLELSSVLVLVVTCLWFMALNQCFLLEFFLTVATLLVMDGLLGLSMAVSLLFSKKSESVNSISTSNF
uniref:NADH dehydrogenase subunit 4L n=1 Tax=Trichodectes canis TaxID=209909 RepID=A0A386B286_9NEOP|nr:NADH dehydrogenase subunit 4L [Trichodectes canis]